MQTSRRYQWVERTALWLKAPLRHCPEPVQTIGLQWALNRALGGAIQAGDFDFLRDRCLAIEVTDLAYRWPLVLVQQQLLVLSSDARADACIRGDSRQLLRLAARCEDPDSVFFQRQLAIEGDTELALGVKNQLDSMEPDRLAQPMAFLIALVARHFRAEVSAHAR